MSASPQRAKDLFLSVLELPLAERDAFLADACGEDTVLRREVESLLQFHDAANAIDRGSRSRPRSRLRAGRSVCRPLSDGRAHRQRRHGRRLARGRSRARNRGRAEGHRIGESGRARADPQRSAAGAPDHPPGRVPRVRRRRSRGRGLLLDGARPRRGSRGAAAPRRPAAVREGRRHRPAAVRGSRGGARAGRSPSRSEARERADRRRRVRADHRLRHCDSEDRSRSPFVHRHAGVHGARAADAGDARCRSGPTCTRWASCCTTCWSATQRPASRRRTARRRRVPRRLLPNVDPQLERLIMQALSPDPSDRPASVREMAAMLAGVGTPRSAGRATRVRSRFLDGRLAPWAAGLALAAAIVVLIVGSSFLVSPERRHADRAGHHRAGRFREHHRRAGVRRHAEGRACGRARAVAVSQSVSGRARAGDAAPDGAPARRAHHAIGRA